MYIMYTSCTIIIVSIHHIGITVPIQQAPLGATNYYATDVKEDRIDFSYSSGIAGRLLHDAV